MGAAHINQDEFDAKVLQSDKPVMVDFYAEWCGPCKMAAPIIDQLADEFADKAAIVKVDVDANNELAGKYGVMSIPTVIIYKDGKEVDRKIGFPGEAGYRSMLNVLGL
jgi:thioredoxin 1